jgi:hypothetical protein
MKDSAATEIVAAETTFSRKRKRAAVAAPDVAPYSAPAPTEHPVQDADDKPDDDVLPLSHAQKRKQKKGKLVVLPPRPDTDADNTKPTGTTQDSEVAHDDISAERGKRQNSIWVGNLSFKTTSQALRAFFEEAGEVTRVNMPMKPNGTQTGAGKWVKATPVGSENKG